MKLRAHPIVRGCLALAGLVYIGLGMLWATTVMNGADGRSLPEDLALASSAELVAVAVVSVPLAAPGVLMLLRAYFYGVTCTPDVIKVHNMLWTRRVPAGRAVEVRRTVTGKTDLWWKGRNGWPRWGRISAFSLPFGVRRYVRQWLEPYNERRAGMLRQWIDERRRR
ncbi:hypothetical protein [Nonomuraea jiangxiensis]|uniref:hypothetical protein n=1 Tax=Nonomuraea jiangxiensis TaxID=633440 RepID=UPI00115F8A28|nr:hypothetical protein [Nonomuraea jiangxiensis]